MEGGQKGTSLGLETPGPLWARMVCRGCLPPCLLVSPMSSKTMSITPLFLQIPGPVPACTETFLPQLFPRAFAFINLGIPFTAQHIQLIFFFLLSLFLSFFFSFPKKFCPREVSGWEPRAHPSSRFPWSLPQVSRSPPPLAVPPSLSARGRAKGMTFPLDLLRVNVPG